MTVPLRALALAATLVLSGLGATSSAQTPGLAPSATADQPAVEPAALQALQRMSAYLGTLTTFELKAENSLDLVFDDDSKVKLDGMTTYKVRRPDGMVIERVTDRKVRRYIYDGKTFTVSAPKRGVFATVSAPPTIRQMLDAAYDTYGINLPLADLLYWSEPGADASVLSSGFKVGSATLDGVATDQYAFSEGPFDWQVWIQQGPRPLPLKVVIVDRTDPAQPEFIARLSWNTQPVFTAQTFAFRPDAGATAIRMAQK